MIPRKFEDLTARRFGRLTVIASTQEIKHGRPVWDCVCDCGRSRKTIDISLLKGDTRSCGCLRGGKNMPIPVNVGDRFGRLSVHSLLEQGSHASKDVWLCVCDCGKQKSLTRYKLQSARVQSCGCVAIEKASRRRTEAGRPGFNIVFNRYRRSAGKRGFSFDLSEEQFARFTQGDCYYCGRKPGTTQKLACAAASYVYSGVDRVDSSKGYSVENCVSCCEQCNRAKLDYSVDEFLEWARRLLSHQEKMCDGYRSANAPDA